MPAHPSTFDGARATVDIRISLLGGFQISSGGRVVGERDWRLHKAASLVKMLALDPAHQLHRDQTIDLLWPHLPTEAASNNLYQALHVSRRTLRRLMPHIRGPDIIRLERQSVSLLPDHPFLVDVKQFEQAAQRAVNSRLVDDFVSALTLYQGELLPEDRYEEWTLNRRVVLRDIFINIALALARVRSEQGETQAAIDLYLRVIEVEPLSEFAHHGLIELYRQTGRRRQALRHYERMRDVLVAELGVAPGEMTRKLASQIERELQGMASTNLTSTAILTPVMLPNHTDPVERAFQTGQQAFGRFAWEDAIESFSIALDQSETNADPNPEQRCRILLALGDAQTRAALDRGREFGGGHCPSARSTYLEAASLADMLDDRVLLARAALGVAGYCPTITQGDVPGAMLLNRALTRASADDDEWHVRLLTRLALYYRVLASGEGRRHPLGSEAEISRLAQSAVELALRIDHPRALAIAKIGRNISDWGPDELEDRLAAAHDVVALAHRESDYELLSWGLHQQYECMVALGYASAIDATLAQIDWIADYLRMPYFAWLSAIDHAGHALARGDLREAERLILDAESIWPRTGTGGWLLYALRREQGRTEESVERIDINTHTLITSPGQLAHRVAILAEHGRFAEARMLLGMHPIDDFFALPRKHDWLPTMLTLIDILIALDDYDHLSRLYDTLLPYAAIDGISTNIRYPTGVVAMHLGRIATHLHRWDDAATHLALAATAHTDRNQPLYQAWTTFHQIQLCALRGEPIERARLDALLEQTISQATAMGMGRLARQAITLRDTR